MFLKKFVKKTLMDAIGHQPDYWVEANALGWFEKGVLDEADLMDISEAIEAKNAPVEEPAEEVEEEPTEEPVEE